MNSSIRRAVHAAVLCASLAGVVGCGSAEQSAVREPAGTSSVVAEPTPLRPPAPAQVGRPTRVLIPAIGVNETLSGVGLKSDGAMQTPAFGSAGWYDLGPRPGAHGPAVIVAHVHGPAGDDVFAELHRLRPGDRVRVDRTDGSAVFVVDSVEQSKKEALPADRIWAETDQALLRLITCGGTPDPVTRMYPENTVVYLHQTA